MIVPALGRWSLAAGRWFVRERIYAPGWTPLCRIRWRYKNKLLGYFQEKTE